MEDETMLGRFSVQVLKGLNGMEAALAADGPEGLELAWSWRPDVIVLDLILPGMSGLELLRQYRGQGGRAKVLVLTGFGGEWARRTAAALGADFLLDKPTGWSELLEAIRLLAGGLEGRCRELLLALGAEERGKGFDQAARCAAMLGEGGCRLLKEAYIEVAAGQKTGMGCVAKNIERMVRQLHRQGTPLYYRLTQLTAKDPPPTNREFLALLSQAATIPL